jgi:hypothetical protein
MECDSKIRSGGLHLSKRTVFDRRAWRWPNGTQPAPVVRVTLAGGEPVLWRAPAGRGAPEGAIVRWCGTRSRAAVTL